MKQWLGGCFCVLLSGLALAAPGTATKRVVEASTLVTGMIVIAPDGSVSSHAVDQPEKLTPEIKAFIDRAIATWRFVPVVINGQAVTARTQMHLRLIAAKAEDGHYTVRAGGASFTGANADDSVHMDASHPRRVQPKYPSEALQARVGGTVYLLLKVGRQGQVLDAAAEQVNLTSWGSERQMAGLRHAFAEASVLAAMRWTYAVPTTGPDVDAPYWVARVPVTFQIQRPGSRSDGFDSYGHWQPYVRGPQEIVPWLDSRQLAADAVDTTPAGSVLPLAPGPQLATPVSGG